MTDLLDRPHAEAVPRGPSAAAEQARAALTPPPPRASQADDPDVIRRRLADEKLVEAMRQVDFEGPIYDRFVRTLAEYGYTVTSAWLSTGDIFRKTANLGRPVHSPGPLSRDDVTDLASETVATAIAHFKRSLMEGRWDPHGGASLRSYFTTTCLLAFPNIYRRWDRERRRMSEVPTEPAEMRRLLDEQKSTAGTDDAVIGRLEVEALVRGLDERSAQVVTLRAFGLSQAEIAAVVGLSVRAVEGRIRRSREFMRRREEGTSADRSPVLTPDELEVARLAASGMTNVNIARHLRMARSTVSVRLGRVFKKLSIRSGPELAEALLAYGV